MTWADLHPFHSRLAFAQSTCGPGQTVVDDVGHCCSPGQHWDSDAVLCAGRPKRSPCGPDQVVVDGQGHCCALSQVWNEANGECVSPSSAGPAQPSPVPTPPANPRQDPPPLRTHRLSLDLGWAYALTPATISPSAIGLGVNYYLADGLGLGVLGEYDFSGNPPPPNPSRWPLQETSWSTEADVEWVPLSAGGETSSLRLDLVLTAGVGAIATRPVAVIVPSRTYGDRVGVDAVAAVALRFFLTRSLSVSLALHDQIYQGQTESRSSGSTTTPATPSDIADYGPPQLFNRLQLGIYASYWF